MCFITLLPELINIVLTNNSSADQPEPFHIIAIADNFKLLWAILI